MIFRWTNNQKFVLISTIHSKHEKYYSIYLTQYSAIESCWKNTNFQAKMFYLISRNSCRLWISEMELRRKVWGQVLCCFIYKQSGIQTFIMVISNLFFQVLISDDSSTCFHFFLLSLPCFFFASHRGLDLQSTSISWGQIESIFFQVCITSISFHCKVSCHLKQTNKNTSENSLLFSQIN